MGVDVNSVGRDVTITNIRTAFARDIANALNERLVYPHSRSELETAIQELSLRHNREVYPEQPYDNANIWNNSETRAANGGNNSQGGEKGLSADEIKNRAGDKLTANNYENIRKINPLLGLLWSRKIPRWLDYRDVFKTPTVDDYYVDTKADFVSVGPKPKGGSAQSLLDAERENDRIWQEMKDRGRRRWRGADTRRRDREGEQAHRRRQAHRGLRDGHEASRE